MHTPLIRSGALVIFLLGVAGCGENKDKGGPLKQVRIGPVHLPQKLSRDDLKKAVLGKSRDEVVNLIGHPSTKWRNDAGDEEWRFQDFVSDPVAEASVQFDKDKDEVVGVNFSK